MDYINNVNASLIADEVKKTASECYGVVGLAGPNGISLIDHLLPAFFNRDGVEVIKTDNGYKVNIYIVAEYGTSFQVIAKNLCDAIKYNLLNTFGVKTDGIRVHIKGVRRTEI